MVRFLTFVVALGFATLAWAVCVKPETPFCAMDLIEFEDNDEFETCRAQMETYREYAETYGLCRRTQLLDDLEVVTKRAREDLDEVGAGFAIAVDSFNRRAERKPLPALP